MSNHAGSTLPEIDQYTRAGHMRFKASVPLKCSDGQNRTLNAWLEWQKRRDPFNTHPKEVTRYRNRVEKEMEAEREALRGPGISKRPR